MAEQPTTGFTIVRTGETAMPNGVDVAIRWHLSGTPDGRWTADFADQWEAEFRGQWEIDLPRVRRGQLGPAVSGSKISWIVPREQKERVSLFVDRQVRRANVLLKDRKLELG